MMRNEGSENLTCTRQVKQEETTINLLNKFEQMDSKTKTDRDGKMSKVTKRQEVVECHDCTHFERSQYFKEDTACF